jgi:hypothetical protein
MDSLQTKTSLAPRSNYLIFLAGAADDELLVLKIFFMRVKLLLEDLLGLFEVFMKKDYSNIFEAAAEASPHKKTPSLASASSHEVDIPRPLGPVSDEELLSVITEMRKIQKEIETKLESLYERSKLSPKSLEQYLDLYSGLGGSARKAVENEGKHLEEQIKAVVGKTGVQAQKMGSSKLRPAKERKSKSIGTRKHWLDMH